VDAVFVTFVASATVAASFLTDDEKRAAAGYGVKDTALATTAKFNPYHDDAGRFTTADGVGGGGAGADALVGGTANDQVAMGGRIVQGLGALLRAAPKVVPRNLPKFLEKVPRVGKIIGDLEKLTPAERAFVQEIRDLGHEIELIPHGIGRTPDFKINGVLHELKTVSRLQNSDPTRMASSIANRISNARGQSANVIIDARQQANMTENIARELAQLLY
jgi:Contact-dependent growth inhibition CdiA C-terminal domain